MLGTDFNFGIIQTSARPLLCLEVNPPRGVDVGHIFSRLDGKLSGVSFLNVTDSALARMRLSALPFGSLIKSRFGIEALVNLSCRDRNLLALQADLLGGWALGVRSVVALTGDAMTIGDTPERKGVFEVNSVGLLHTISTLNSGKDLAGHELKGKTDYFPGVVVNPNVRNPAAELKRLRRKAESGARYALSQPIFDGPAAISFLKEARQIGVPIFVGLLALKTGTAALAISRVPGLHLPEAMLAQMEAAGDSDVSSFFIDHCLKLAEECRPYVCGYHVVSGATPLLALQLLRELARYVETL